MGLLTRLEDDKVVVFFGNRGDVSSHELTHRINMLILGTKYTLTSLQLSPQHFGNAVIELACDQFSTRFVYDRGDIYRDIKIRTVEQWTDQQLVYSHTIPHDEVYDLLIKAVEEYITQ